MATKRGDFSQYDMGGIAKHIHDEYARAARVVNANSEVPSGYSRVEFEYNLLKSITSATFYRGVAAEKTRIKFLADVSGNLNGTYFFLNAAEDKPKGLVWYNVDGSGIDPALLDPSLLDYCRIEIPLRENDPVEVVTLATKRYLENCEHFLVESNSTNVLLVETSNLGYTTASVDVDTGFHITTSQQGATDRVKCIELPEESGIRYIFNHAEGKFEIIPAGVEIQGLTVESWQVLNVDAAVAGTEYSVTLPISCRRFEIRTRSSGKFQIASLPGNSGTVYRTIPSGNTYKEEGLVLTGPLNIYFQCTKDNDVLEAILYF